MNRLFSSLSPRRWVEFRTFAMKITADGKDVPKRKIIENRVTLIGTDNNISITDLRNAQSLSQRRELKLVKIQDADSKTRRPVYKLMTNAEYHEEELSRRKEKKESRQNSTIKGDKLITLSTRIGEHDLMTGVRKMMKLLEKQYEVKVVISGDAGQESQVSEKIYSVIENNIKSLGKVVQKRTKGNNLRFQLVPEKQMNTNSSKNENLGSNQNEGNQGPL